MKILQINKFFYIRGGASRYFFEVSELLKSHGHKLAYFSMLNSQNQKSEWSKYFVSNISFEKVELKMFSRIFARMLYSFEARRNISKLLDSFRPDIVHLHSIYHHLSPSIILELKKRKIPIVQTLHDYHLISPNHTLFHNGRICEITKPIKFYKAIFHRCVKNSYLASLAEIIGKYLHCILGWERNYIDFFIAPSRFMKSKLVEYGLSSGKVIRLPHFINYNEYKPNYEAGDYILYFGRLSSEKGLDFLINVMTKIPKIRLKIVGRGLIKDSLKQKVKRLRIKNVDFLGHKSGEELKRLVYESKFMILPSLCYEIFPISMLEAFACGKPVIASKIGGIPGLVEDDYNGFLFKPGNIFDMVEKINYLWNQPEKIATLGKNAREYIEKNFGPEEHYQKLMKIYQKAIKQHQ